MMDDFGRCPKTSIIIIDFWGRFVNVFCTYMDFFAYLCYTLQKRCLYETDKEAIMPYALGVSVYARAFVLRYGKCEGYGRSL